MPDNSKRKKLEAKIHNYQYEEAKRNAAARKAVESWPNVNLVLTLLAVAVGAVVYSWLS